jgi:hypothetical protein
MPVLDPCNAKSLDYGECSAAAKSEEKGGQLDYPMGHPGLGVACQSGLGDGEYEVWAHYVDDGTFGKMIGKLEVIFCHPELPSLLKELEQIGEEVNPEA